MSEVTLTLDESQRQMVLLALAHLAIERPGWDWALAQIAFKIDNHIGAGDKERPEMFDQFKRLHEGAPR